MAMQRGFNRIALAIALVIIAVLVCGGFWYWRSSAKNQTIDLKTAARAKVERGDMVVTILQAGELESKNSKGIGNDTDRNRQIMFVIDDGARVRKGDLLLELDSADLADELLRIQSNLSAAEAQMRKAKEDIEISKVKYDSDLKSAELKLDLAKLDMKKYEEAEFPQSVREKEIEITLARETLQSETNKLDWTKKLVEKGYANRQDLEKDQLAVNRNKLDLAKSEEELRILQKYTRIKDQREKSNAITEAAASLNSVKKTFSSMSAQAQAALVAAETTLALSRKEEAKKQEEIRKMRVLSEYEGQVFYAKGDFWGRSEPIEKGASVYGRQKILEFPDLSAWQIKTRVPESIIERVKIGQHAVATVDAISNKTLQAKVMRVGAAPDRGYYDTSQKVYPVILDCLTTTTVLKPGMSLMVEIITNEYHNVLKVPMQAVTSQNEKSYVYRIKGDRVQKAEVKTADNNEQSIQIMSGISEGDEVLLYAPVRQETRAGLKDSPLQKSKDGAKKEESGEEGKTNSSENPALKPSNGRSLTGKSLPGALPGAGIPAKPAPAPVQGVSLPSGGEKPNAGKAQTTGDSGEKAAPAAQLPAPAAQPQPKAEPVSS